MFDKKCADRMRSILESGIKPKETAYQLFALMNETNCSWHRKWAAEVLSAVIEDFLESNRLSLGELLRGAFEGPVRYGAAL